MKNATAIAASAGLVLAVAGVSGAMYVSAAQDPASGEVPPATEVIVEYIDEQGNVVPIETTVAESDTTPNSTTESSAAPENSDEYQDDADDDHDEYDDDREDDDNHEDDDHDEHEDGDDD
ncbi:MAG: hypothetical protein QNM02_12830 [Acidimicrobiia bacterium]|nr:hypothetical protein [Acidimicrobiia bacterium]